MRPFFDDTLLLSAPTAKVLYETVRELPIVDCHCHLDPAAIREDRQFTGGLAELWLGGDHYKWRAMRMCGVPENEITGDAPMREKYRRYAEIFPLLCGNPLYYFTQLELKLLFGITEPLSSATADSIRREADRQLSGMRVSDILRRFRVTYVGTTDDPADPLSAHGRVGDTLVCPTFRPDRVLRMEPGALADLEKAWGRPIGRLSDCKQALSDRLDLFVSKGCRMADHGMDEVPLPDCGEETAERLFAKRFDLDERGRAQLFSHLFYALAAMYKKRDLVLQMHIGTYRNVNTAALETVGRDAGFDVMRERVDTDRLAVVLNTLHRRGELPRVILYSLVPGAVPAMATLSGAFPEVRIGAAWWFSDSLLGIRRQLETIAEYAVLGTHLGMLTDSRSFASYARFDFFRRILADMVGGYVERGEYDMASAERLMAALCGDNIRRWLKL